MRPIIFVTVLMVAFLVRPGLVVAQPCPTLSVLDDPNASESYRRWAYNCHQAEARARDEAEQARQKAEKEQADAAAALERDRARRAAASAAANAAAARAREAERAAQAAQAEAEASPLNKCKEPEIIRLVLSSYNELQRPRGGARVEAVDVERVTTTGTPRVTTEWACRGIFVLSNGDRIPGAIEHRLNAAGDSVVWWRPDRGTPIGARR